MRSHHFCIVFFVATGFILNPEPAAAQTSWTDGTDSWFVPTNWSAGVPTGGTDANINNGGTAQVGAAGATARRLNIGSNPADSGTVVVDGTGTLSVADVLNVGLTGRGTMNITNGGTVSTDFNVFIGSAAPGVGRVTVDGPGSALTVGNYLYLAAGGAGGTGTLNITNGGAVSTLFGSVFIGDNSGGAGTVLVDGSLAVFGAFTVTINAGGLLTGSGIVHGPVFNSGVVAPGDSPGILTINGGNYTNNSNGTFRSEIGGLAEGVNADLLRVFGNAIINGGTLEIIRFGGFTPSLGDRVTIIRTEVACSRTGEFDTVVPIGWTGLIQPFADYSNEDTLDVVFQLAASFHSQGETPNQKAVGGALDRAAGDNCAPELVNFAGNLPLPALPHTYDLIAPEELSAIYEIGFSQAVVHNDNLIRRMDDIRAGSNGYCGPVVETSPMAGKDYNPPIQDKNIAIPDKNVAPAFVSCPENHWGVFATGSGDFVNVDGDENAHGYDIDTGSFIAGVDYRIGRHFAIGIDGGYASSRADLVDHGHIDVDGGKIGGYATVYGFRFLGGNVHLDGGVNGGWNSYDTRRTGLSNSFPDGESVNGDTNGSEFNAFVSYGTDYNVGCLTIGTWSTIQYTDVSIDGFTEHGSLAPLHIEDQDQDSFRGTTGIRASYDIRFGHCGIIRPEIRAAWQHESSDQSYAIDANFIDCNDTFTVHGPKIGRDSALVGAGLNIQWCARLATYVNYDGVLGRENYTNNAVSGGLRFGF